MIKRPVRIVRSLHGESDTVKETQTQSQTQTTYQVQDVASKQQPTMQMQPQTVQPTVQVQQSPAQQQIMQQPTMQIQVPQNIQKTQTQPDDSVIVYKGQDNERPQEKSVSLTDYLIQNKWWLVIAVAVAHYALKSED